MIYVAILWLALAERTPSVVDLAREAQAAFESGNYSLAQAKLQQATRLAPQNAALWSDLAVVHAQLNQINPAIAAFEKALSLDPQNPKTCFNLGLLYSRRGAVDKALGMYRKGLRLDPDDTTANKNYAFLLIKTRNFPEAVVPLQRLKAIGNNEGSVRISLIESYFMSGMNPDGEKEIWEFLQSPEASQTDQLNLATLLLKDKLAVPAEEVLKHAVVRYPDSPEAHGGLGLVLSSRNQFEDAVFELGRACQLAPDSANFNMGLAEALLKWGHFQTAIDFLVAVKGRFGNLPEYHYKLARAYYGSTRYSMAIRELEPLTREHFELDLVHGLLGACYLEVGDTDNAETQFRQALELNPNRASYYFSLAQVLRKGSPDKTDEAIGYLKKALILNPTDYESKLTLAFCYEKKLDFAAAQHLLEELVKVNPGSLPAHRSLARIYFRQGKKGEGDKETGIVAQLEAKENQRQLELRRQSPRLK